MKRLLAGITAVAAVAIAPGAAQAQDDTQITLLHGIPGATVDVAVDGQVLLPGFEPGTTQDLTPFAGQVLQNVSVLAAGTEDVVIGPVPELAVPESGNWTVMAHLDAEGTPTIAEFENDASPTADGQGRLTVRHTAAAPAVDLVVGEDRPIEGAENGDEEVLDLPAGQIAGAQLAPAGGDPILDVPPVDLAAGTNLIVYAVGSLDDESIDFYIQAIPVGTDAAAESGGDDTAAETGSEEAAAETGGDETAAETGGDDGTPVPTQVNTGEPIGDSTDIALLAAAFGLLTLAGGALALRYRTVER